MQSIVKLTILGIPNLRHLIVTMNLIKRIINFYIDGFRNLDKVSIKLWIIIGIKLFIMFAILKLFFFPDFLNSRFDTDEQKSEYVIQSLTKN